VAFTLSQLPPLAVLGWAVQFRVPEPPLRMSTSSVGGPVPPCTTEKLRPEREIKTFGSALTVIVTGMRAVCPATSVATSISPAYVPATPPAAFGVTFDGSASTVHGTGVEFVKAARLIATQTKRSFYPVTAADILGGTTGASVKKLTALFARAKENSPSIIFIDEMDGLLPRNTGVQSQHDIQLVEQARSLISELEPQHNVFLIGTTNHLESIDPAILRGGRFSEKLGIGTPDQAGYRRLLKKHLDGVRLVEGLSSELLAERLSGASPADLEAICNSAKRMAMRRMAHDRDELPPLVWRDFAEAMKRVQVQ